MLLDLNIYSTNDSFFIGTNQLNKEFVVEPSRIEKWNYYVDNLLLNNINYSIILHGNKLFDIEGNNLLMHSIIKSKQSLFDLAIQHNVSIYSKNIFNHNSIIESCYEYIDLYFFIRIWKNVTYQDMAVLFKETETLNPIFILLNSIKNIHKIKWLSKKIPKELIYKHLNDWNEHAKKINFQESIFHLSGNYISYHKLSKSIKTDNLIKTLKI